MKIEYGDQQELTLGNVKQLSISHIGYANLPTHFSFPLRLENVLDVPKITKNLVIISQLTAETESLWNFMRIIVLWRTKLWELF